MLQPSRDEWQAIIELLQNYACHQLANGLRQEEGIGQQAVPTGSLNGFHAENRYVQVVSDLAGSALAGIGHEVVCRSVDIACFQAGIQLDVSERDAFAHLLSMGEISVTQETEV